MLTLVLTFTRIDKLNKKVEKVVNVYVDKNKSYMDMENIWNIADQTQFLFSIIFILSKSKEPGPIVQYNKVQKKIQ